MKNRVRSPLGRILESAQNGSDGAIAPSSRSNDVVAFILRWYMRIAGTALIGYALFTAFRDRPPLETFLLVDIPLLALGIGGIAGSFFMYRNSAREMLSLLVALLAGLFLLGATINDNVSTFIVSTGIDQLRAQLVAALLLTSGTAFIGGFAGRRKWGASLGAMVAFWFGYLVGFIQLELTPAYDPGKNLLPLNTGAFIHTLLVMGALSLLSAFVGAAVGAALSEVLIDPFIRLVRTIRKQTGEQGDPQQHVFIAAPAHRQLSPRQITYSWLAVGFLLVSFLLASSAQPLFIYSPDIGLHGPPVLNSNNTNNNNNGGNNQPVPSQGTVVTDSLTSQALGGKTMTFDIYLPPSYNVSQFQSKRYPTLYLLHGSPGSYKDWVVAGNANQSADTLIDEKKTAELIMVFPDGNGQIYPSEWGNSYNQKQMMETYVVVELVNYVDHKYRTIPDAAHRGIGGLSMGGFGSMNIAVHHPDVFGTVISLGGYYRADSSASVWGGNASYIQQNSPIDVLPNKHQAWKLHIFLGAGSHDQPYYSDTQEYTKTLDSLKIPYKLDIENGGHAWSIWQTQLYNALLWVHWG
jgi:enterochelin esterase-like enzyme